MTISLSEFKASNASRPHKAQEFDSATAPNLYVPMGTDKVFGDGTPINSMQIKTRGDLLKSWFGEDWKEGALGTVYKACLFTVLSLIGVIVFYGINLWIAAVFAYLTGYFWSTTLVNYAWGVQWFKGKALISTK